MGFHIRNVLNFYGIPYDMKIAQVLWDTIYETYLSFMGSHTT